MLLLLFWRKASFDFFISCSASFSPPVLVLVNERRERQDVFCLKRGTTRDEKMFHMKEDGKLDNLIRMREISVRRQTVRMLLH
jgi:hypothetical protein